MPHTPGNLNVTELDFHQIKDNLKAFLKGQTEFDDYDFDGSTINAILDLLAYTTHYNAFNANMALNESFLDTAQIRSSVVSHAKLLGYTPRSAYAPRATIDILINNPTGVMNLDGTFRSMLLPRGTVFKSIVDGSTFNFVNVKTIAIPRINGIYKFGDVELLQGEYKTTKYTYDKNTSEKFVLPSTNAVTSSLIVTVRESTNSSNFDTFVLSTNLVDIVESTKAYWIQESKEGFYEVYFGDGKIGQSLFDGNIIELEYVVTESAEANGASKFTLVNEIDGNSDITITTIDPASGGAKGEDVDSIKFNAPLGYIAQNRAVTPDDYKTLIQTNFPNIRAISVWGGEDNDPPDYGKVFITIAPKDTEVLSFEDKEHIKARYLKPKNVVSITPVIIDPTYTYISLDIFFKYNPNTTTASVDTLEEKVRNTIITYQENELKQFDGVFRYSTVLSRIDNTDFAIINSFARVYMMKRFSPEFGPVGQAIEQKVELRYAAPILKTTVTGSIITSSEFVYLGQTATLQDILSTSGVRIIRIVSSRTGNILHSSIGFIEELTGKVILNGFAPSSIIDSDVDYIEIRVPTNSYDLAPNRNELLTILTDDIQIVGEIDTMITGGTSAGIDYTTTSKEA